MKLKEKVIRVLAEEMPGSKVDLEIVEPALGLFGTVVWSGFEGMSQVKRHRLLRDILKKRLTKKEQDSTAAILTFIPEELSVGHEV